MSLTTMHGRAEAAFRRKTHRVRRHRATGPNLLSVDKDFLLGPAWAVLAGMIVKAAARLAVGVLAFRTLSIAVWSGEDAAALARALAKMLHGFGN